MRELRSSAASSAHRPPSRAPAEPACAVCAPPRSILYSAALPAPFTAAALLPCVCLPVKAPDDSSCGRLPAAAGAACLVAAEGASGSDSRRRTGRLKSAAAADGSPLGGSRPDCCSVAALALPLLGPLAASSASAGACEWVDDGKGEHGKIVLKTQLEVSWQAGAGPSVQTRSLTMMQSSRAGRFCRFPDAVPNASSSPVLVVWQAALRRGARCSREAASLGRRHARAEQFLLQTPRCHGNHAPSQLRWRLRRRRRCRRHCCGAGRRAASLPRRRCRQHSGRCQVHCADRGLHQCCRCADAPRVPPVHSVLAPHAAAVSAVDQALLLVLEAVPAAASASAPRPAPHKCSSFDSLHPRFVCNKVA